MVLFNVLAFLDLTLHTPYDRNLKCHFGGSLVYYDCWTLVLFRGAWLIPNFPVFLLLLLYFSFYFLCLGLLAYCLLLCFMLSLTLLILRGQAFLVTVRNKKRFGYNYELTLSVKGKLLQLKMIFASYIDWSIKFC